MARNISGVYALPANGLNPVVTRTAITTTWANTTLGDMASEITNSLDRGGRGAMVAPLQLPDGTAALPSLTFSSDTNTGVYRVGADSLGFSAGGTVRARIDTGQVLTIDGALATPALSFLSDTDTGIYRAGANDLRLAAGGLSVLSAVSSGANEAKVSISAGTAATGGTRKDALSLTNGDLDLSGVTAPTSTTALSNRVTPLNIPKAWVVVTIVGDATYTITVNAGFNITSVARTTATTFTITFASSFAATSYGAIGQVFNGLVGADQILFNPTTRNTGSLVAGLTKSTGGSVTIDGWANTVQLMVVFYGAQ